MKKLIWRILDPLLLRIRARLEHLDLHHASTTHDSRLRECGYFGSDVRFGDRASIVSRAPREHLHVGNHSLLMGGIQILNPSARIAVGHHCFIGYGSNLWCSSEISIGNYVQIAHNVDVIDSNSHSTGWQERRLEAVDILEKRLPAFHPFVAAAAVRIEDDTWIGTKSTILKGVTIGRGAIIAAGTVVTKDVPPFTLVGGNPMRTIKTLPEDAGAKSPEPRGNAQSAPDEPLR